MTTQAKERPMGGSVVCVCVCRKGISRENPVALGAQLCANFLLMK